MNIGGKNMKKALLLLLLLIVPFMLVGCGDKDDDDDTPRKSKSVKVIECELERDAGGMTIGVYTKVEFNEKKQEVGSAYAEYTYDYSSQSQAFKDAYEKQDICSPFNSNDSFKSCKAEFKNDKAVIHTELNTEKLKSNDKEKVTAEEFANTLET